MQASDLSDRESGLCPQTVALVGRKARASAEVAAEVRGGRRLLPAVANRLLQLFRKWRIDGRLRRAHDRLTRCGTRKGRARVEPQRGGDRQPGTKDHPGGRPRERLRRGQAHGRGANATSWLTHRGGLVLAARVHGADLPEREGGRLLLEEEREGLARMELLWADGAYTGGFWEWL